jgi:hypothetical protein
VAVPLDLANLQLSLNPKYLVSSFADVQDEKGCSEVRAVRDDLEPSILLIVSPSEDLAFYWARN